MMMVSHTPGPWIVKKPGEHSPTETRVVHQIGNTFAMIAEIGIHRTIGAKGPSKEEQANARLIAAAPQLLVMLKEAVEMLYAKNGPYVPGSEIHRQFMDAIAEAEGSDG